jgi:hypothetical protein
MHLDSRFRHLTWAFVALAGKVAQASEPPNVPAQVNINPTGSSFEIRYDGHLLFSGKYHLDGHSELEPQVKLHVESKVGSRGEVTQVITLDSLSKSTIGLIGRVSASSETFPAETYGPAQERFKLVRNSVGLSKNLRNNSLYDRQRDWMLESDAATATSISPVSLDKNASSFLWTSTGSEIKLEFRPRYYQKHKNVAYFRPWEYQVWRGSVTGWCSWWAYMTDVREKDVEKVSKIFSEKLKDFGYSYIQIDDGYQASGGGLPKDWLNTNDHFPSGLSHLSKTISDLGLEPALWLNVHFGDKSFVDNHKSWFIQDANGEPHKGPWIDYGLDGSNKEAVDTVVRPTYRALHKMGWRYVKVDALRHLLYDSSYPSKAYFKSKGIALEDAYRGYLKAIRQEVGDNTYMLACWGVLPEVVGIADGCRLGGDGFGPSTLQQYTSWNNVVWRNDPDHCDIKPLDHQTGKYIDGEERIRPVLVSMAGGQLLLSDKPDVYENDANLEGVKRSSPILFTVPGQLYDYDPVKTDHLKQGLRNDNGGAQSGPIDADQKGEVCPWWMLDINQPFESWTVLTHMNWDPKPLPQAEVKFEDLGLPGGTYSVFEFWSKRYLGEFKGSFTTRSVDPKDVATYAIRKTLDHPQILSTSRHISQGAVDLERVAWNGRVLSGSSRVIKNDPYSIYLRVPEGYTLNSANFGGVPAEIRVEDHLAEIKFVPTATKSVGWRVGFK